jgi:hypothetical protein
MRLEIADTPYSARDAAANYRAIRDRLLNTKPPAPPKTYDMARFWSMRLNAGVPIRTRFGNAVPGVNLTRISQAVCEHFQVTFSDLKSARRTNNLVMPRHIICYLARRYTGRSMPEIGRWLGGRDHTTILHGIRQVNSDYERFRDDIEAVIRKLGIE